MQETAINWTEFTWNPVSGCTQVSEGCKYCYALTLAERYRGQRSFPNGFDLTIRPHKLKEPYRLKTPSLIFVNSMSDLFWDAIPDDYRHQIVDVIEATPQHQYQVLTKRPEAMLAFSKQRKLPGNFWAGTTIEGERTAFRLDILKQVDAEIRFLSIEPMLHDWPEPDFSGIQWVITGGESGSHLNNVQTCARRGLVHKVNGRWEPRPDRIEWVRHIRDACLKYGTAFWHKQWGGPIPKSGGRELDGRTWDEFPRRPVPVVIPSATSAPIFPHNAPGQVQSPDTAAADAHTPQMLSQAPKTHQLSLFAEMA